MQRDVPASPFNSMKFPQESWSTTISKSISSHEKSYFTLTTDSIERTVKIFNTALLSMTLLIDLHNGAEIISRQHIMIQQKFFEFILEPNRYQLYQTVYRLMPI